MEIVLQIKCEDMNEAKNIIDRVVGETSSKEDFNLTNAMLETLTSKGADNTVPALTADQISTAILQNPEFSLSAKNYYINIRKLPSARVKTAMNQGIAASGLFLAKTNVIRTVGEPGKYRYYLTQ